MARKLGERGWEGDAPADIAALVAKLADLGYIDDAAYATMKADTLTRRGYGERRLGDVFFRDGIGDGDRGEALSLARDQRWDSAVAFARRKRIGCFATTPPDENMRRRQLGALLRAGHDMGIARCLVALEPGADPELYRPDSDG